MGKNPGLMKLTLLLVSSLTIMSIITISPALPGMTSEFRYLPNAEFLVKMILTIPALMIAVVSPITGKLIDKYGRISFLRAALVLYALSGVSGFFLDNIYAILFSRMLLGISVGVSMTIVITLIADYFEGAERQKFVGLQVAFMSIGGILFIGIGGFLADIGWRYPFLIYLFSLLVLPMCILYLEEPQKNRQVNIKNENIKAPAVIWAFFFNTMLLWILFFMIPVQIPFHLKALHVEKNALIGAAIAISTLFSAVSSISFSRIKNKLSFLSIFTLGYFLMACGYFCISIAQSYGLILLAMVLAGLGMGLMIPNTNMWVMKVAPPAIRGKEIGKLTTFWFLGQFLSPIVIFPVITRLSIPSTFLAACFMLLGLALLFLLLNNSKRGKILNA